MSQYKTTILINITLFVIISVVNSQEYVNNNIINRQKGNILRNLTNTQQYEDNIVTSSLDASNPIRFIYRGFREVYSRYI